MNLLLQSRTDGEDVIIYRWIEQSKRYETIDWIFIVFVTVLLLIILIGIISLLYSWIDEMYIINTKSFDGIIIDKGYKPEHTSSSIGFVANGSNGLSPVSTTNYSPEDYSIVVRLSDGEVVKVHDIDMQSYYDLSLNQSITVKYDIYWLSKTCSEYYI